MHPLRVWRQNENLTLRDLGERLGKTMFDLHRIETGQVKRLSVAAALKIQNVTSGAVSVERLAELHPG